MARFCTKCGTVLDEKVKFCTKCGASVPRQTQENAGWGGTPALHDRTEMQLPEENDSGKK